MVVYVLEVSLVRCPLARRFNLKADFHNSTVAIADIISDTSDEIKGTQG